MPGYRLRPGHRLGPGHRFGPHIYTCMSNEVLKKRLKLPSSNEYFQQYILRIPSFSSADPFPTYRI